MAQLVPINLPLRMQCLRVPVEWRYERRETPVFRTYGDETDHLAFRAFVTAGKHSFFDPWEMRAEFFRLRSEDGADRLIQFLQNVGLFNSADPGDVDRTPDVVDEYLIEHGNWKFWVRNQPETDYAHFFEMQYLMRLAMESKNNDSLENFDFQFRFIQNGRHPCLLLTTVSFLEAMAASIQIDRLRKARFQKCMRPDCSIPFAVTGERARKYCSWYCGHLESVRNKRKLDKAATHVRKNRKGK